MNKIDFRKQNIPFTQVANGVLFDKKLSLGAKGLYSYLYSKPDGWDFSEVRIANESKNGRNSVRTALKELESSGYLLRYKLANGRMVYKVIFPPIEPEYQNSTLGKPEYQKATVLKSHSAESVPISNTDLIPIKKNTTNGELRSHVGKDKGINGLSTDGTSGSFLKKKEPTPIVRAESDDLIAKMSAEFGRSDEEDLISVYMERRKMVFKTKESFNETVKRHRRIAKTLVQSFTVSDIIRSMDAAARKYPEEWTLETCYKLLTK